jgi:hypothetical protein
MGGPFGLIDESAGLASRHDTPITGYETRELRRLAWTARNVDGRGSREIARLSLQEYSVPGAAMVTSCACFARRVK